MTVVVATVGLLAAFQPAAFAYQFGEPDVRAIGPEERVFDWSVDACEQVDLPDTPARAFRDDQGRVQLIDSHAVVRRMMSPVGGSLHNVRHSRWTTDNCQYIFNSDGSTDPAAYNDKEWIHSTYTIDGRTIYGLVHNEYQGWNYNEACTGGGTPNQAKCWYNAATLAVSTNSGLSYNHAPAPSHLVASIPYQYVPLQGPSGVFKPSNIIKKEGWYYAMVLIQPAGVQQRGVCLMRTQALGDPTSWRAWNGTSFSIRFINPYVETGANPADHVCEPVSSHPLRGMEVYTINWSTHFNKYVLVGAANKTPPGFYFSVSDDLISWTEPKLLMAGKLPYHAHQCGDPDPVRDAALLDPATPVSDRNFENIGKRPYLYFTEFNYFYSSPSTCWLDLDRDVMRIQVEFADPPNQLPVPSFTASPNPALTGQVVTFNGSASSDPDGTITNYEWDLDGIGDFETDTNTTPNATRSYTAAGPVTVRLRVTDNRGGTNETTRSVTVNASPNQPPTASFTVSPNPALKGAVVTFDGSASSDPGGSIAKYEWDLDGNGSFETDTGTAASTTQSYATAGAVTVRLRVTDNGGSSGDTTRTLTVQNQPPAASFTASPNPATAGQPVTFDGTGSSDPDGTIARYAWDLDGNGSFETDTGTAASATGSYGSAGTVTVGLQVTDNDGDAASTTRLLTVNSSPITGPPQPSVPPAGSSGRPAPLVTCASVRQRRARLVRKRRVARRKLAAARTNRAKRRYRLQIRSLNRTLKRLSSSPCAS